MTTKEIKTILHMNSEIEFIKVGMGTKYVRYIIDDKFDKISKEIFDISKKETWISPKKKNLPDIKPGFTRSEYLCVWGYDEYEDEMSCIVAYLNEGDKKFYTKHSDEQIKKVTHYRFIYIPSN